MVVEEITNQKTKYQSTTPKNPHIINNNNNKVVTSKIPKIKDKEAIL